MAYGTELILDLHECDAVKFNRKDIDEYFRIICETIDMQKCERYWWDDVFVTEEEKQTLPHTKGTSAIQFILTSNITIHTLDLLKAVYLNIFSCKPFDTRVAERISAEFFNAKKVVSHTITRT